MWQTENIKIYVNDINSKLNPSCRKNFVFVKIGLTVIKMMTPLRANSGLLQVYEFVTLWKVCVFEWGERQKSMKMLFKNLCGKWFRIFTENVCEISRRGFCFFNDAPLEFDNLESVPSNIRVHFPKSPWINHIKYLRAHLAFFP